MLIHVSAVCFWIFHMSVATAECSNAEKQTKRILLNDPDVITARITALENMVSQSQSALEIKISQLQTELSEEKTKNAKVLQSQSALENKISQLQTELSEEKTKNANLRQTVTNIDSIGPTYVRWGRTTCPGYTSDVVYSGDFLKGSSPVTALTEADIKSDGAAGSFLTVSNVANTIHGKCFCSGLSHIALCRCNCSGGYAAGSNYLPNHGSPSNTLCLPNDPELSNYTFSDTESLLYGSEYEHNTFASDSAQEDMPCVVCRMKHSATTLMIPGRKSCYRGWNIEYIGLLASGANFHSPSTYLCVDSHPEYIPSGQEDKNGNLFYVVGYKCGSLPCPPYHDNRIAYCVVCSK